MWMYDVYKTTVKRFSTSNDRRVDGRQTDGIPGVFGFQIIME